MIHDLKIEQNYLRRLMDDEKKAEIRFNDRDYQVGDTLQFHKFGTDTWPKFVVTHIHSGLGMKESYVCLSVKKL